MAFVYRAPKKSPFEPINQAQQALDSKQYQIGAPTTRIHHEKQPKNHRKLQNSYSYSCSKNREDSRLGLEVSDSVALEANNINRNNGDANENTNNVSENSNVKRKKRYNFRSMTKNRIKYNSNKSYSSDQSKTADKKQYYDLPGSLSHKTLVKYIKKLPKQAQYIQTRKKSAKIMPGPGSYTPQLPTPSPKSPIFHEPAAPACEYLRSGGEDKTERQPEENLFAVKYQYMNSSSFKKSMNLVGISNRALMGKLLGARNRDEDKENGGSQYVSLKYHEPGPGAYNSYMNAQAKNKKNGQSFGNSKRFQEIQTDGAPKFYDNSSTIASPELGKGKEQNETSCFCSQSVRFDSIVSENKALQYTDYKNSMIKVSKNRGHVGFQSRLPRAIEKTMDKRPYYDIQIPAKKELAPKFDKFSGREDIFKITKEVSPGPQEYNTSPSWHKEHSCLIKQDIHTHTQSSPSQQNDMGANFYLCSQTNLQKPCPKSPKNQLKSKKLSASPIIQSQEVKPQQYYSPAMAWQKKSFNLLFSPQVLPANNPIKNKML